MNKSVAFSPMLSLLVGGACFVIIIAGMKEVASTLNIVLLALLLAQSLAPLPNWLQQKKCSTAISVLITILLVVGGGLAVLALLASSVSGLLAKFPAYKQQFLQMTHATAAFLQGKGVDLTHIGTVEGVEPVKIMQFAGSLLGLLAGALGNGILLLILGVIFLLELAHNDRKLASGEYTADSLVARVSEINAESRKFVVITALMGLLQAVAKVIALYVIGVDFAATWGVLFFFCNFIPMVGFLFAVIPPVFVALLELGWQSAAAVAASWWIINFIGDNIVKPKFMKDSLDISFLIIVLGVLFWSWVLGPVGAILAIPLTLTLRRIGKLYLKNSD
ncbi:MAG TPA: AI-2E family transporter [Dissulfurispiraceae bacterium]|nr:AI-2E family transporter [Dissulfurispiraceae bacterium]